MEQVNEAKLLADIVGQAELADELGVTRAVVSMWILRYANFPAPVLTLKAGRFYRRSEVLAWHQKRVDR